MVSPCPTIPCNFRDCSIISAAHWIGLGFLPVNSAAFAADTWPPGHDECSQDGTPAKSRENPRKQALRLRPAWTDGATVSNFNGSSPCRAISTPCSRTTATGSWPAICCGIPYRAAPRSACPGCPGGLRSAQGLPRFVQAVAGGRHRSASGLRGAVAGQPSRRNGTQVPVLRRLRR